MPAIHLCCSKRWHLRNLHCQRYFPRKHDLTPVYLGHWLDQSDIQHFWTSKPMLERNFWVNVELRKAGHAPGHKPVVVVFAFVFVYLVSACVYLYLHVSICICICICCLYLLSFLFFFFFLLSLSLCLSLSLSLWLLLSSRRKSVSCEGF